MWLDINEQSVSSFLCTPNSQRPRNIS